MAFSSRARRGHGGWSQCADGFSEKTKTQPKRKASSSLKPMPDVESEEEETILDHSEDERLGEDIQSHSPCKKISRREESQASSIPSIDDPCTPQKSLLVTQELSLHEDTESDSVPFISASTQSPPIESCRSSKTKIGEWAKSIQSNLTVTPQKNSEEEEEEKEDSTKKNTKYSRDGYANRLRKLIGRERSQHAFWKHKNVFHSTSGEAISREVSVTQVHEVPSMVIAECTLFPRASPVTVLFRASLWQTLALSVGCSVAVHPPWQILHLSEGREVMLCTNQCVAKGRSPVEENVTQWYDAALWDCPCATGKMRVSSCPAYKYTINLIGSKSAIEQPCVSPPSHSKLSAYRSMRSCTANQFSDSILKSIELNGEGATISFEATVVKVFCRDTPKNSRSSLLKRTSSTPFPTWSVLLCDARNFICELLLPPNQMLKPPWDILTKNPAKKFSFSGIQKLSRIPREKQPALFSIIDSVCSPCFPAAQQTLASSSQLDSQNSMSGTDGIPLSFTYCLQPKPGEGELHATEDVETNLALAEFSLLKDLTDGPSRCHFQACVIFVKTDVDKTVTDLYVSDTTFSGMHLKVDGSWIPEYVLKATKQTNLIFHDVLTQKEFCSIDGYSRILPGSDKKTISQNLPSIAEFSPSTRNKHLILISGCVSGVDEARSFSCSACNFCQSENLIEKSQGNFTQLFCTKCQKLVEDPLTRISMEVVMKVKGLRDSIQVKLTQKTSEKLLSESTKDDSGYDSTCLTGKDLRDLRCIVLCTSPVRLHEAELLE